jgi:hypothetical protein
MKFILFILIFFSISCAQRMKAPISRLTSPETIGNGVEIDYRQTALSEGQLDFTDGKTDNALQMNVVTNRATTFSLGAVENADFFVTIHQESSSLLGLKVMLIGEDNKKRSLGHKLAFTLANGSTRDSYKGEYVIKLKSNVKDYAIIYGYRTNSLVLFYTGVSLSSYEFKGSIQEATDLDSNSINYTAQNIWGWNGGLEIGSSAFKLKVELATQKIQWSYSEEKLFYAGGFSLAATF